MLPKDPMILLSFVNTQLRDNYATLEEFCSVYEVSKETLTETLKNIDYEYDKLQNQFI